MILLFVETGIQYVDLDEPLDFLDAAAGEAYQFQVHADGSVAPRALAADDVDGFLADESDWTEGRTETNIVCTPTDALEIFSRQWIPVPYHSTNPLWVRAFLEPMMGPAGQAYHVVLACDTHSRTERRDDGLGILRGSEIGYTFSINPDLEAFWAHPEVQSLAHTAWRSWLRRTHPDANPSDANSVSLSEGPAAALAKLWALVRYLAVRLPDIRFAKGSESEPIDAHLVLDLGNCRTCGIIVETPSSGGPFFASLEMRSHELPRRRSREPFESHMQFVRSGADGQAQADDGRFNGISLIRLGDEALEAGAWGGVTGAVTGMSSPKRYLWDDSPRPTDWCFVTDDVSAPPGPIEGTVLRYIDPERPFRRPEVALLTNPPSPRYSRKSGLVFVLLEILEQAFGQMNSVAHRRNMPIEGGEARRRIFRSLVLVHPSGMTPLERKELAQGARRALDIWFDSYRDPIAFRSGETELMPPVPTQPKPAIHMDCDEGSAVQLCYLYGEAQERFQGDAEGFLATTGRKRDGQNTLRVASLDVGGGTTDLVISQYRAVPGAIGFTCLQQQPLFRDGISLGGDDIARAVLTEIVFREMAAQLGVGHEEWRRIFSQTTGPVDPSWETVRRQLVSQVWIPLARYYWGWTEEDRPEERVTLRQILSETHYPAELLDRFNTYLAGNLVDGGGVDVSTLEFVLSAKDFRTVARKVFSRPLFNFCDVIAQFDCDMLIVAGRAAGLPELMKMLVEYCPLPPARITSLQGHQVEGTWFPFAKNGVITDAKSCVVVGAALHFISTKIGGRFVLQAAEPWTNEVIIGVAEPARQMVPNRNVLFDSREQTLVTGDIMFAGNLWIGCRHIADELAYANALYEVTWTPRVRQAIANGRAASPQATIRLARNRDDPFTVKIHSAKGTFGQGMPINRDKVAIKLHTIYSDDYWLDTGCFYD